ncbi:MAG TPA: hypothetical protein VIM10_06950 [Actinopolymorphaceae bacterium]
MCYAELAAAVPTPGSSYTYADTTIGEIFAWIIAWDLILEFALGAAFVSRSGRRSARCRRARQARRATRR